MFLGGKRRRMDRYAADRSVKRLPRPAGVIKWISGNSLRPSFATAVPPPTSVRRQPVKS